jgi:GAF domain-containing protein
VRGDPQFAEYQRQVSPLRPAENSQIARLAQGGGTLHRVDAREDEAYRNDPAFRQNVDGLGIRTSLTVPLRKGGALLGAVRLYRPEVRPFTDKQIALLENFAAQAVIAMENARLLTETREALEQQTATAEVLQVINSSPGDLTPVFDAMLEGATRLCQAEMGAFWTYDGEFMHAATTRGVSPELAEYLKQGPHRPSRGQLQLLRGERVLHTADITEGESYRSGDPLVRAAADLGGIRTLLVVPLCKDNAVLGTIGIYRREIRPFSEKQIALLQNFAAQAVIAMENARLLTETREALEQQTATAEVLQVINSSPGDLAPVFEAMLDKALRLCGAGFGRLETLDGGRMRIAAHRGFSPAYLEFLSQAPSIEPHPSGFYGHFSRGEPFVHRDVASSEAYRVGVPMARALVDLEGGRTALAVPLRRDSALLGGIVIYRREGRPFTDKQIALLQNFAAQAVIAMENARLLTETREALEQQTATAEVLGVINSSPGDLAPVFNAMLEKTLRLCEAAHGNFLTYDGEVFHTAAVRGEPQLAEYRRQQGPLRPAEIGQLARVAQGGGTLHRIDARDDDAYRNDPAFRKMVDGLGIRTSLTPRPAISLRYSTRCSQRRCICARRLSAPF